MVETNNNGWGSPAAETLSGVVRKVVHALSTGEAWGALGHHAMHRYGSVLNHVDNQRGFPLLN